MSSTLQCCCNAVITAATQSIEQHNSLIKRAVALGAVLARRLSHEAAAWPRTASPVDHAVPLNSGTLAEHGLTQARPFNQFLGRPEDFYGSFSAVIELIPGTTGVREDAIFAASVTLTSEIFIF